ncbi:MAG: ATP-dependent helicase [Lachnospiraceae bacterium]|nr:ATP-dependent helicase [Lachnospiraceae bacterium]
MAQSNNTTPRSNPAQEEAIRHQDGPMLVLAGPGSGKTYVITNRVRHLIEECLVPPEQILVITFSRAAAGEMKQRFDTLTERLYPGVTFGTFHACFFHMLQYARGFGADSILRETDAISLMSEILIGIRPEYAEDPALVRDIYEEVLRVKCHDLDTTQVELFKYKPSTCDVETFSKAFTQYRAELGRRRKVDFEDMLLLTRELLTEDAAVLDFWRRRYRYLLVDEFQDVNHLQYEIVRLLTGADGNLFAVGDDDQSIYGFRGSDPQIMQRMPKDMPSCRVITLPVNYRSTPQIVGAADALIANNQVRYKKEHTTSRPSGSDVRVLRFDTVTSENEFLLSEITALTIRPVPSPRSPCCFAPTCRCEVSATRSDAPAYRTASAGSFRTSTTTLRCASCWHTCAHHVATEAAAPSSRSRTSPSVISNGACSAARRSTSNRFVTWRERRARITWQPTWTA